MVTRKRDRLTSLYLLFLFIVYAYGYGAEMYNVWEGRARAASDGLAGLTVDLLLLVLFLWSLVSIWHWNRQGFALYVAACAIVLVLRVYRLIVSPSPMTGELLGLTIGARLLGPLVSALLLWASLHLGSPTTWQQMERRSLLELSPTRDESC